MPNEKKRYTDCDICCEWKPYSMLDETLVGKVKLCEGCLSLINDSTHKQDFKEKEREFFHLSK